jgi:hypothetical protein
MRTSHRWLKRIATLGFLLTMGASMNASAGLFGIGGTSWKEEVLLHDGSKIVVERWHKRGGRHEIGSGPPIKEQGMTFEVPGTGKTVVWRDDYSEDVGSANFGILALHILNRTPYIVATPYGYLAYNKWGRPNPPYVIFKHGGIAWQRIQLSELPAEFKSINLVIGTSNNEKELDKLGKVSVADIKKMNRYSNQPELSSILREAITGLSSDYPIPTTVAGKPIAPEIDGKLLYYNWWPLAQDWLKKTYSGNK